MKKRLFIAINLAPEPQKQVGYLLDQLQDFPDLKTVPRDQLHLTLIFLGDTDENEIPVLQQVLDKTVSTAPVFAIEINQPTLFANDQDFRGIWLPIKPNPTLDQLVSDLRIKLRAAGFSVDPKPFAAHITLARAKTGLANAAIQQWLADWQSYSFPASPVTAVILYSSQLTPAGPIHTPEHTAAIDS